MAQVVDAGHGRNGAHQFDDVGPHGRFAAGQAYLVDAQAGGHLHEEHEFVVGHELMLVAEAHLLGHAVDAAQVAHVGEANAQVVDASLVGVKHWLDCVRLRRWHHEHIAKFGCL